MSVDKKKKKRAFSLDSGLVALLSLAFFSSILTFRKFSQFKKEVDSTMSRNLETMRDEHKRSLDELRALVNSGLVSRSSSVPVSVTNSVSKSEIDIRPREYRALPVGLKLVRAGDWYVSDGVWKYGVGDVSPVGLITNIVRGVVFTEIDTFSCVNSPTVYYAKSGKGAL